MEENAQWSVQCQESKGKAKRNWRGPDISAGKRRTPLVPITHYSGFIASLLDPSLLDADGSLKKP